MDITHVQALAIVHETLETRFDKLHLFHAYLLLSNCFDAELVLMMKADWFDLATAGVGDYSNLAFCKSYCSFVRML